MYFCVLVFFLRCHGGRCSRFRLCQVRLQDHPCCACTLSPAAQQRSKVSVVGRATAVRESSGFPLHVLTVPRAAVCAGLRQNSDVKQHWHWDPQITACTCVRAWVWWVFSPFSTIAESFDFAWTTQTRLGERWWGRWHWGQIIRYPKTLCRTCTTYTCNGLTQSTHKYINSICSSTFVRAPRFLWPCGAVVSFFFFFSVSSDIKRNLHQWFQVEQTCTFELL